MVAIDCARSASTSTCLTVTSGAVSDASSRNTRSKAKLVSVRVRLGGRASGRRLPETCLTLHRSNHDAIEHWACIEHHEAVCFRTQLSEVWQHGRNFVAAAFVPRSASSSREFGSVTYVATAPWLVVVVPLAFGTLVVFALALGLVWRIGAWHVSPAASLTLDEGLALGSEAPEIAAHADGHDYHLSFQGRPTFLVFGAAYCAPCVELIETASRHPATRSMRRVYVGDGDELPLDPDVLAGWEIYELHDVLSTRQLWRAPVSPYFYVIASTGRVLAKGIANLPGHLDRLLALPPLQTSSPGGLR